MAEKKAIEKDGSGENKLVITRSKGFSYLTYLKISTGILLKDNEATIETNKKWLYFIKGKQKTVSLDYKTITNIEVKTVLAFWDLLFAMLFLVTFVSSKDVWLLIIFAVFLICSFGKNIVISRNNLPKVIIPADGIGSDKEVIKNICDDIRARMPDIGEPTGVNIDTADSKKTNILDALPFKSIVEQRIPSEKIENNPTLKKLMPHMNIIGVGIIAIIVFLVLLFSGPSTAGLEKRIWAGIEEQQNIEVTDLKLIKIQRGVYTGIVEAKTILGTTASFDITVVTDGRNVQWEINY